MIQQNYTHDSLSPWKRVLIFLVDALISFGVYLLLLLTIGSTLIKSIEKENIEIANQEFIKICEEHSIAYEKENQYGFYQMDFYAFMDNAIQSGLTSEEAYEKYYEKENEINKLLNENKIYVEAYNSFYITYVFTSILSMLVSLFIFQFLFPLLNKKHQTLGMKIFKGAIVNQKSGVIISSSQVLLRFIIIFTTEFLCVYVLLDWFGLIFLILISLFLLSFSKSRASLHDLILKCQVKKQEYAYTE